MSEADLLGPGIEGKKVFFLYPPSVIQNEMVLEIVKNEYAVYLLHDHTKIFRLMALYPDSILFINLDEGLKEVEWEALIREMNTSSETQGVRVGILTYNNSPELAQKYLMDLSVSCGFIKLSLGLKQSTEILLKALEANEARGRRRFLRVKCPDRSATFNLRHKDKQLSGQIVDISSVGMSCFFDAEVIIPVRTRFDDIQLKLRGVLAKVSAVVFGTRHLESGKTLFVLLFDLGQLPDAKQKIRVFIQQSLQSSLDAEIKTLP
ncbi:MAG: PilZ domain-containing protein [Spirochaetales bacterium]|nr:PilZ domain-containing protein [Spirochaetales bacterium]